MDLHGTHYNCKHKFQTRSLRRVDRQCRRILQKTDPCLAKPPAKRFMNQLTRSTSRGGEEVGGGGGCRVMSVPLQLQHSVPRGIHSRTVTPRPRRLKGALHHK